MDYRGPRKDGPEKDMSFKIGSVWHRWFKSIAVEAQMPMRDIFQEAVEAWAIRHLGEVKGRPPGRR